MHSYPCPHVHSGTLAVFYIMSNNNLFHITFRMQGQINSKILLVFQILRDLVFSLWWDAFVVFNIIFLIKDCLLHFNYILYFQFLSILHNLGPVQVTVYLELKLTNIVNSVAWKDCTWWKTDFMMLWCYGVSRNHNVRHLIAWIMSVCYTSLGWLSMLMRIFYYLRWNPT